MQPSEARVGVILAAGLGSRLAAAGESCSTKPLAYVCGEPLLHRTLRSLEIAGCAKAVVVLGHKADHLRREIEGSYRGALALEFAYNPNYTLNNGTSVLAARAHIVDEYVVTMADHVLGDEIMHIARAHRPLPGGAALCVDSKLDAIFDMDDATKVWQADGLIQRIGKTLQTFNCVDTGVFICTVGLTDALQQVFEETGDASLSQGVQVLASQSLMEAVDIGDGFWQDVDTPEMLAHAEAMLRNRGE